MKLYKFLMWEMPPIPANYIDRYGYTINLISTRFKNGAKKMVHLLLYADFTQLINRYFYVFMICHLDVLIIFSSKCFLSPGQNLQHWLVSCICFSGGHVNCGQTIDVQLKLLSVHVQFTQPIIVDSPCSTSLWLLSKHFPIYQYRQRIWREKEQEEKKNTHKKRNTHKMIKIGLSSWKFVNCVGKFFGSKFVCT